MSKQTSKKRTKRKSRINWKLIIKNIDSLNILETILALVFVIFMIFAIYEFFTEEKNYTYYLNGEFDISNKCYIKNDNAYCVIDEEETKVDLYYEVEQ